MAKKEKKRKNTHAERHPYPSNLFSHTGASATQRVAGRRTVHSAHPNLEFPWRLELPLWLFPFMGVFSSWSENFLVNFFSVTLNVSRDVGNGVRILLKKLIA
jgi:hypothetical protein